MNNAAAIWRLSPKLLEITLLLLIAWIAYNVIQQPVKTSINPDATNQNDQKERPEINIESIITSNLFGTKNTDIKVKPTAIAPAQIQVSKLQLSLQGTVVSPERSAAFIKATKTTEERVFFIGDKIIPSVTLVEIATTHIIVSHHNRHEKIMMEKDHALTVPADTHRTAIAPNNPSPFNAGNNLVNQQGNNPNNTKTDFLNMISLSGLAPKSENGRFIGITVNSVIAGTLFSTAGLKKGDIIKSINGKALRKNEDTRQAYEEAKKSGYINIELIRDGQSQIISKNIP